MHIYFKNVYGVLAFTRCDSVQYSMQYNSKHSPSLNVISLIHVSVHGLKGLKGVDLTFCYLLENISVFV